jgi:hypothetical protein
MGEEDGRWKTGDGRQKTGDGRWKTEAAPRLRVAPSAVHPVQILTERFDRVKTPEEADGRRKCRMMNKQY